MGFLGDLLKASGGIVCLLLFFSWDSIDATQMALRKNWVLRTVDDHVLLAPGLQFIGPFHKLIKYPRTIQLMEYDETHKDIIDGRSNDGLPIILGVAFQYRLLPHRLRKLYADFEHEKGSYVDIFKLLGIHYITEETTHYSAYEFFTEKQKIALHLQESLNKYFQEELHAEVTGLQILENELPELFKDTIITAGRQKQLITQMERTRDAKIVEFTTARNVARAQANVTIQHAMGQKFQILQDAKAETYVIDQYVSAELDAYSTVNADMNLKGDSLIKYIWYDTLAGGNVQSATGQNGAQTSSLNMFVGVDPSAYVSDYKPP